MVMPVPDRPLGCPPGLEYLTQVDQLLIHQKVELMEGQVPLMPVPQRPDGCPPGLEYLTQIDQLLVHQKVELAEVILGWETNNKYMVKNSMGQQVFYVAEENDCCNRQFCGPLRSFVLHVQDNLGQEVMTLTRPLKCGSCCFPCCLQEDSSRKRKRMGQPNDPRRVWDKRHTRQMRGIASLDPREDASDP
ncbi:Phospholipid scramblase 2 [Anabarilius grahami]|uniref:Phospholipid scramblase n=1 Tax=Anabarilius grahami TaxID=495550 RepID=A0A3N0Z0D4_ANAGA|nr:Phospholipid scramblase 2 [Anabarilius grahami]